MLFVMLKVRVQKMASTLQLALSLQCISLIYSLMLIIIDPGIPMVIILL